MCYFLGILKISSLIAALNSHWTNTAVFSQNCRSKPLFFLIQALLHFRLVMDTDASQFKQTESQQRVFFDLLDKKRYKTNFQITVISLLRLVNSNLEILLIRKTLIENDVIKWLPAFY